MDTRIWDGNEARTRFFYVDNSIDWNAIVDGEKTQMRSVKQLTVAKTTPHLVMATHGSSFVPLILTRAEKVLLGLIDEEGVRAEGHEDVEAFRRFWCSKNGVSYFSAHERVYLYEFKRFHFDKILNDDAAFAAALEVIESVYPTDLE